MDSQPRDITAQPRHIAADVHLAVEQARVALAEVAQGRVPVMDPAASRLAACKDAELWAWVEGGEPARG